MGTGTVNYCCGTFICWGLSALQSAAIIVAFPFSFVLILMLLSLYKDGNAERMRIGLTLKPDKKFRKSYQENQNNQK